MDTVVNGITYSYVDPEPLPDSRNLAMAVGSLHYDTGKPCRRGHVSRRYTPTTACLACERERKARAAGREPHARGAAVEARALARLVGEPTYQGDPCAHGHGGERYTSNGHCVPCTRAANVTSNAARGKRDHLAELIAKHAK